MELQACIHPTVMKDMCAECGADLRKDDLVTTASVPMIHTVPELKVSVEVITKNCTSLFKKSDLASGYCT